MKLFTALYDELDGTMRTGEKVAAIRRYFDVAPPEDAAWALALLSGRKTPRAVTSRLLRDWCAERAGVPDWLIDDCYEAAGDLAEALALALPTDFVAHRIDRPLHWWVQERLVPLRGLPVAQQRDWINSAWSELDTAERLVWHKLLLGSFRVGVSRGLVERALAEHANLPQAIIAHRMMGPWQPTAAGFLDLFSTAEQDRSDPGRPFPFYLASPLDLAPEELGDVSDWLVEWKWDGIRAQIIRRNGHTLVWSRGAEMVTDTFPDIAAIGDALPDGAVLDGEIVAWDSERGIPAPFGELQKRLGRRKVGAKLLADIPARLIAYDLLESSGIDRRAEPLRDRRARLTELLDAAELSSRCSLSTSLTLQTWADLDRHRRDARLRNAEGVMLKRLDSPYGVGRKRGSWWKWKTAPLTIDAVMIYAQAGHGRRASLFTDYTFGVWRGSELVPIAKAYSGLTDAEMRRVDKFIRENTLQRFGPVRTVAPRMVFELHFEAINASSRHKSGIAVRFPRIGRIRDDKRPEDADTLETLQSLAHAYRDSSP